MHIEARPAAQEWPEILALSQAIDDLPKEYRQKLQILMDRVKN